MKTHKIACPIVYAVMLSLVGAVSAAAAKADWEAQLTAMYADYDNIEARIDGVAQIITYNDAEVHPMVRAAPQPTAW